MTENPLEPASGRALFGVDAYPEIAHLHWSERDRIIQAASRRMVKNRRWLLVATGSLRFALLGCICWISQHARINFILLAILALSMVFDFWPRRRGMRRALSAELLARGMRPLSCLICGYDLRASRERCPECGTTIAAPLAAEKSE